jgi:hypothetical protein
VKPATRLAVSDTYRQYRQTGEPITYSGKKDFFSTNSFHTRPKMTVLRMKLMKSSFSKVCNAGDYIIPRKKYVGQDINPKESWSHLNLLFERFCHKNSQIVKFGDFFTEMYNDMSRVVKSTHHKTVSAVLNRG